MVGFDTELGATRRIPATSLIAECLWLHVPDDFPGSIRVLPPTSRSRATCESARIETQGTVSFPALSKSTSLENSVARSTGITKADNHLLTSEAKRWETEWQERRDPMAAARACRYWWEAGAENQARNAGNAVLDIIRESSPLTWDDSQSMVRVLGRQTYRDDNYKSVRTLLGNLVRGAKSYDAERSSNSKREAEVLAALMDTRIVSDTWLNEMEVLVAVPGSNPNKPMTCQEL